MTETTEQQIDAMRSLCAQLDAMIVRSAHVDDWGRNGNFTIHVVPHAADRFTTNRLKSMVRQAMPKGAHLRTCFAPDPVKKRDLEGRMRVVGYERSFWALDIDFQNYHADTNSFTQQ